MTFPYMQTITVLLSCLTPSFSYDFLFHKADSHPSFLSDVFSLNSFPLTWKLLRVHSFVNSHGLVYCLKYNMDAHCKATSRKPTSSAALIISSDVYTSVSPCHVNKQGTTEEDERSGVCVFMETFLISHSSPYSLTRYILSHYTG